jgi:iron(III) transport system substrate-binding protein
MNVFRFTVLMLVAVVLAACTPATPSPTAAPSKQEAKPTTAAAPAQQEAKPAASPAAAPAKPAASPAAAPAQPAASPATAQAKPAASPAAKAGVDFQRVLEAAKQEASQGPLLLWVNTPNEESTHRALFEAFNKRFGLNAQYEWLPLHATEGNPRVIAEAQAGRPGPDVVYASAGNMKPVDDAGLIEPFDWVGVFGNELPGIKESDARMVEGLRGKGLAHWDVIYAVMFNKDQITVDKVPNTIESLADPQWKGKLAINAAGAAPFDVLSLELGEDRIIELVRKMVDNGAVMKRGSPAVVASVVQGEAPLGIGFTSAIETEKKKGAPVDWKPFDKYIPVLPLNLYVPKTSQRPNLGRLFTAWLVTEGIRLEEEREFISRATDPGALASKRISELAPQAKVIEPKTPADVVKANAAQEKITAALGAAR